MRIDRETSIKFGTTDFWVPGDYKDYGTKENDVPEISGIYFYVHMGCDGLAIIVAIWMLMCLRVPVQMRIGRLPLDVPISISPLPLVAVAESNFFICNEVTRAEGNGSPDPELAGLVTYLNSINIEDYLSITDNIIYLKV
uniref:Uncharacterized protein n=1 Tax=Glossina pallidipes TaxID=7398 RepID=A0A1B0A7L3_GLOPL